MLQLAIECSGLHGSVAILEGSRCLELIQLPTDQSSVQSLASSIDNLVRQAGHKPQFISVTHGPGSFTGLRVGLTTAKMLAFAWQISIVPVDTLELLAYQIVHRQEWPTGIMVVPVINAFRQQVFTAVWMSGADKRIVPLSPSTVVDAALWMADPLTTCCSQPGEHSQPGEQAQLRAWLDRGGGLVVLGGPGLQQYSPSLVNPDDLKNPAQLSSDEAKEAAKIALGTQLPAQIALGTQPTAHAKGTRLPASASRGEPWTVEILPEIVPQADWVGRVALEKCQLGLAVRPERIVANYIRSSAAEEKTKLAKPGS